MKKLSIILVAIVLLIIVLYSSKDVFGQNYTYKGENELWTAEYKVNVTKAFTDTKLTVSFKKDLSEISSVKHFEISYESSIRGGKLTSDFDSNNPLNQKTYTLKSNSSGGAIVNKNEIIKVNINLDGKIETIELKNAN